VLEPTRRFAHATAYVERCAQAAGLQVLELEQVPLRLKRGLDVLGCVATLWLPPRGSAAP
jgi:predicted TPR repeat methyltransferase